MASSGTYTFSSTASNGSLVLSAFERCRIRAPSLRQEHMLSAQREFNFLLSTLSNLQPNLWTVTLVSETLVEGTETYDVDAKVVMVLDAYISLNYGTSNQTDRYISPMSRTDYAAIGQKQTQGQPTSYWFDRTIDPTITLWTVPDGNGPYTLNYYACTQMQDANLYGGETPNVPYRWIDALVAGLAHRLSRIYAPEVEAMRKVDAKEAWDIAAAQDTENVNLSISPSMQGYYR